MILSCPVRNFSEFRHRGPVVPGQQCDRLHRNTARGQQRHERPGPARAWRFSRATGGQSPLTDPLQSHLPLADGELSLLDLSVSTGTSPAPWLVLASACQSATVDVRRLPDEFAGLPTGFLVSGVATFVGTLWPTGDVPAALMTMRIIELMFPPDPFAKILAPARALRRARAWLRNLTGAEFTAFAAGNPAAFAARYPSSQPYAAPSVGLGPPRADQNGRLTRAVRWRAATRRGDLNGGTT